MKILFIQPYISFNGVLSDTLPGQLARKGHQIEVISYIRKKNAQNMVSEQPNIRFTLIDALSISIPFFVTEFPYFLNLENVIKQIKPDIIHINNLPFLTTLQSVMLAKKMNIKSIVQVHGVMGGRGLVLNLAQKAYIFTFGHLIFRNADSIICLTANDAQKICRYGCPSNKIHVISNGVDVSKFYPLWDEVPDLVLWCGRFIHQKGLKYLIEALKIAIDEEGQYGIKLAMTGEGPLLPTIYNMVKKNELTKNVFFTGLLPREKMPAFINKASIYLLPSLTEGMPYVLLEAMACGKPVVGSDISGINDVITNRQTGLLVPPGDSKALSEAILELLNDRVARRVLGKNARQLMTEKYSWDIITKKIEKLYCEENKLDICKPTGQTAVKNFE